MITRSLSRWSLSHRTFSSHAKPSFCRKLVARSLLRFQVALEELIWINAWPACTVTNAAWVEMFAHRLPATSPNRRER